MLCLAELVCFALCPRKSLRVMLIVGKSIEAYDYECPQGMKIITMTPEEVWVSMP